MEFISASERLSMSAETRQAIVKAYEGDIRSCLNAMQFQTQNVVAFKDVKHSILDMLRHLFTVRRVLPETMMQDDDDDDDNNNSSLNNVHELFHYLSSDMGNDLLIHGCFENYPLQHLHDSRLFKVNALLDATCFHDFITSAIHRHAAFSLLPYTLLAPMMYHFIVAREHYGSSPSPIHPVFQYYRVKQHARERSLVLSSVMSSLSPSFRSLFSRDSFVRDVAPSLPSILSPPLRDVSDIYLMTISERHLLFELIELHHAFGLTYVPQFVSSSSMNAVGSSSLVPLPNYTVLLSDYSTFYKHSFHARSLGPNLKSFIRDSLASGSWRQFLSSSSSSSSSSSASASSSYGDYQQQQSSVLPSSSSSFVRFVFQDSAASAVRKFAMMDEF